VGKTTSQFSECRPRRDATDFLKEVVRQRQADESRSRLEFSMQVIRYVAKLNHLRHAHSLSACGEHVNSTTAQTVSLRLLLTLSGGHYSLTAR
jgi:hypothetical protein